MGRTARRSRTKFRLGMLGATALLSSMGGQMLWAQQQPAPPSFVVVANGSETVPAPAADAKPAANPVAAPTAPLTSIVQADGKTVPIVVIPSSKPVTEEQGETSKDDASHQGIRVHGHWVIDVRNPDGTLAEHRDFQNSLVGSNDMLGLLYGSEVMSDFTVYLAGSTPPCVPPGGAGYYCDLVHNSAVLPANARCTADYCAAGLTITPTFGASPALVLAGNLTATQAGTISTVGTLIGICGTPTTTLTSVSAASCAAGNNPYGYGALTQTGITPLSVTSGQLVQVTVTISFS